MDLETQLQAHEYDNTTVLLCKMFTPHFAALSVPYIKNISIIFPRMNTSGTSAFYGCNSTLEYGIYWCSRHILQCKSSFFTDLMAQRASAVNLCLPPIPVSALFCTASFIQINAVFSETINRHARPQCCTTSTLQNW